jgi:fission process protein 1
MAPLEPNESKEDKLVAASPIPAEHKKFDFITKEDYAELTKLYDKNRDGRLDEDEIGQMIDDYNHKKLPVGSKLYEIFSHYDIDKDGKIDIEKLEEMKHAFKLQESDLRYAAYSLTLARLFRYLAFTSDFGEALRPVIHKHIVNATYAVAFGYCIADISYEAYKLKRNNYINEKDMKPMTMTQCVVERATFQAFASLVLPAVVIHQTVHVAKNYFTKIGKFTKWGPSLVGLSLIPFLPVCLDEPVERIVEYGFHHYGPWSTTKPHESGSSKKEKEE